MVKKNSIKLFGDDKIRAIWDDEQEKWYFSIVDVIAVLTESPNPQTYWRVRADASKCVRLQKF